MKLGIWAVAVVLSIFHSVALSQEITNDTLEIYPPERNLTDLTVSTGIKYTVVNSPSVIVQGTFWNNGSWLVFNNARPLQLRVKGPEFYNFGTISFNSISYVEEASYAIWAGGAFWNSGTIYFGACKTPFEEVPFIISSTRLWYNEGRMIFKKTAGSIGELFVGGRSVKDNSLAITNQGTISLYNTHWGVQTNINGNGCIVVGSGSRLNLDFASGATVIADTQTIYLESADSVLGIRGLSTSRPTPLIRVTGLGEANMIDYDIEYDIEGTGFEYFGNAGLLAISYFGRPVLSIKVGASYDTEYLRFSRGPLGTRLNYQMPNPNRVPSKCSFELIYPDGTNPRSPISSAESPAS